MHNGVISKESKEYGNYEFINTADLRTVESLISYRRY